MAKTILLYDSLHDYSVERFIRELDASKGSDINILMHSPGGDPYSTYGALAAFKEFQGAKKIDVHGYANSCAFYMCCVAAANGDTVECLDVSTAVAHRASMGSYIENNKERFTDAMKAELNAVNTTLRAMLEGVTTPENFKKVTGVAMDAMFSLDSRIDVRLTAKQLVQLGIVKATGVKKLTPQKKKQIEALSYGIAALNNDNLKLDKMESTLTTLDELKSQYPSLYAEARKAGVTAERDRVCAALVFVDTDAKAVTDLIKSGEEPSRTFYAEMGQKQFAATVKAGMEASNATATTEEVKTENPDKANASEAEKAAAKTESERRIAAYKKNNGIK